MFDFVKMALNHVVMEKYIFVKSSFGAAAVGLLLFKLGERRGDCLTARVRLEIGENSCKLLGKRVDCGWVFLTNLQKSFDDPAHSNP